MKIKIEGFSANEITGEYLGVTSKTTKGDILPGVVIVNDQTNKVEFYPIGLSYVITKLKNGEI